MSVSFETHDLLGLDLSPTTRSRRILARSVEPRAVSPVPPPVRTVTPREVRLETVPLPPERLLGPAEPEFDGVDVAWFRQGAAARRPVPFPVWVVAIPILATAPSFLVGALVLLWVL